jgi:hypothetical protein
MSMSTLWGSRSRSLRLSRASRRSLVLVDQATKNWTACDPFVAGIGNGVSRSGWAKAAGAVRSAAVVVPNIVREHCTQMPLVEDQRPVGEFSSDRAHNRSAKQFARGHRRVIRTTRMPTSARTASNDAVN